MSITNDSNPSPATVYNSSAERALDLTLTAMKIHPKTEVIASYGSTAKSLYTLITDPQTSLLEKIKSSISILLQVIIKNRHPSLDQRLSIFMLIKTLLSQMNNLMSKNSTKEKTAQAFDMVHPAASLASKISKNPKLIILCLLTKVYSEFIKSAKQASKGLFPEMIVHFLLGVVQAKQAAERLTIGL